MIPPPPGNKSVGIASGALAAGSAIGFVLERDRQPDPVAANLAVLDGDVLAGHFGDADFPDCRRGGLDRGASSMLPRFGARADDLGHAVDTHVLSFSWAPPANPGTVLRTTVKKSSQIRAGQCENGMRVVGHRSGGN